MGEEDEILSSEDVVIGNWEGRRKGEREEGRREGGRLE